MARLYLRMGDRVEHMRYTTWGVGTVVEERTSSLPGGFCMVRIRFEDGEERSFINDLDDRSCCRNFGIRFEGELDRPAKRIGERRKPARRMTNLLDL